VKDSDHRSLIELSNLRGNRLSAFRHFLSKLEKKGLRFFDLAPDSSLENKEFVRGDDSRPPDLETAVNDAFKDNITNKSHLVPAINHAFGYQLRGPSGRVKGGPTDSVHIALYEKAMGLEQGRTYGALMNRFLHYLEQEEKTSWAELVPGSSETDLTSSYSECPPALETVVNKAIEDNQVGVDLRKVIRAIFRTRRFEMWEPPGIE
jgi:hypothetical protein